MKRRSLSRVSSLVRKYDIVPNSYFVRALTDELFQAFLHRFYLTAWWSQLRSGRFLRIGMHFTSLSCHLPPFLTFCQLIMLCRFMTPMMLGVCAFFFWVATKVHTNNALFIYCQRCEGGGKIFYYWNRIVFVTIYSSIVIVASVIALKAFPKLGIAFLVTILILTYCVDKSVETTFAIHSLHLPISMARIHDKRRWVYDCDDAPRNVPLFIIVLRYITTGLPSWRVVYEIRRGRKFHVPPSNTETWELELQADLDLRLWKFWVWNG